MAMLFDYEKRILAERRGEAIRVAQVCHGMYDWQGCQEAYGTSGLTRLANSYLRKDWRTKGTGARVGEQKFSDGTSRYYPRWELRK